MIELRLAVFSDKPSTQLLDLHAKDEYNLFHDTVTDVYFLTDGGNESFETSGFSSDYHRVLDIPFNCDTSELEAFKSAHADILEDTLIHYEILTDALALSQTFSTRVLCVYSNDEDCDFAVTAENGKRIRLRYKAGRQKGHRVDDEVADHIKTEISAVRVLMEGEESAEDDGVFEYTAFEVIQTRHTPLGLHPYWRFREGEIGGQFVFDTLSSTPNGIAPNLFFRTAILEFEEAFGASAPDFTDMPDAGRFERVSFKAPTKLSAPAKVFNFAKSLFGILTGSRKGMIWTAGAVAVLAVILFRGDETPAKKTETFSDHCVLAGGKIFGEFENKCQLGKMVFRNWNLPGANGERRVLILHMEEEPKPCTANTQKACPVIDGEIFTYEIDGFESRPGEKRLVPVERLQICVSIAADDCPPETPAFQFRQLVDLRK